MLVEGGVAGVLREPRLDVDQGRRAGDQDRQRNEGRDDGEGEPDGASERHRERHRDRQGQQERGERPRRAVQDENNNDHEQTEQREVSLAGARRLGLQVGVDVRAADSADAPKGRRRSLDRRERAVDRRQRFVALARAANLQLERQAEEIRADQPLPAEQIGSGGEAAEVVRPLPPLQSARMGAAVEIQGGEDLHARDLPQTRLDLGRLRQRRGSEGVGRLRQQHHLLPFGEQTLERLVVLEVVIAFDDQTRDRVVGLDTQRLADRDGKQDRVQDDPPPPSDHDETEDRLQPRRCAPIHGADRLQQKPRIPGR